MTTNVLYLCRGAEKSEELFFAQELPDDFYSPGLFVIEAKTVAGRLHNLYRFAARQGGELLDLELRTAKHGRAFIADAGANGKFYFKAVALSRSTVYAGNQQFSDLPLFRLEPANMQLLEQACRKSDFYFTGNDGAQET